MLATALGDYRFRWSTVETMRWNDDRWLTAAEIKAVLAELPDSARSGDVYALRADAL